MQVTKYSISSQASGENAAASQQAPQSVLPDSIPAIRDFLGNCHPSMVYFLPSLINLGFTSDDAFEGVLNWPMYELVSVLEKWKFAGYITAVENEALRIGFTQLKVSRSLA
jgi:hypothetical protein